MIIWDENIFVIKTELYLLSKSTLIMINIFLNIISVGVNGKCILLSYNYQFEIIVLHYQISNSIELYSYYSVTLIII